MAYFTPTLAQVVWKLAKLCTAQLPLACRCAGVRRKSVWSMTSVGRLNFLQQLISQIQFNDPLRKGVRLWPMLDIKSTMQYVSSAFDVYVFVVWRRGFKPLSQLSAPLLWLGYATLLSPGWNGCQWLLKEIVKKKIGCAHAWRALSTCAVTSFAWVGTRLLCGSACRWVWLVTGVNPHKGAVLLRKQTISKGPHNENAASIRRICKRSNQPKI